MNVLYLHRTQGNGVEGVHINGVASALERRGFEVSVVCPGEDNRGVKTDVQKPGISRKVYGSISRFVPETIFELLEISYNVVSLAKASFAVRRMKPKFIYERYAFFAVVGAIISRVTKVPLVLEINYLTKTELVRKRSRWLLPFAAWAEAFALSTATVIVAVSSFLRDQLTDELGVGEAKLLVTPNAVNPTEFDPSITRLERFGDHEFSGRDVIGFVGGFYPWHGLDLLIDAFETVRSRCPSALLVLVGDGPKRPMIQNIVAMRGLSEDVVFTGKVFHSELPPLVATFSIGVMPDSNAYGSPMKIFEYMAMSIPVVAPDYGPIRDVIRHKENGVIFDRKNSAALSEALAGLLEDQELMRSIGRGARKSVEEIHNWDHSISQLLERLYVRAPHIAKST